MHKKNMNMILAHDQNFGIGMNNNLPWPFNEYDMKWFSNCTKGSVILMGRKTWDSTGYLKGRTNVVLSTKEVHGPDHTFVLNDVESFVEHISEKFKHKPIFVIGGASVYKQFLPFCRTAFVSEFEDVFESDTKISFNPKEEFPLLTYFEQGDGLNIEVRHKP